MNEITTSTDHGEITKVTLDGLAFRPRAATIELAIRVMNAEVRERGLDGGPFFVAGQDLRRVLEVYEREAEGA